jgi:hypothetical protein
MSVAPGVSAQESIYIRWAHLETYSPTIGTATGLTSDSPGLLVRTESAAVGALGTRQATIRWGVSYMNNRPQAVSQTLSLDIYGEGRGNSAHFGYWNLGVPAGQPVNLAADLDVVNKTLSLLSGTDSAEVTGSLKGDTGDGTYTASLLVYENGQVAETFNDIFRFTIQGGRLSSFAPRDLPPLFR